MNIYRSIGGRANASGVERINRDGEMEILQMGDAEVTPTQRENWNAKSRIDDRKWYPDDRVETNKDNGGTSMNVDFKERTRLPRESQYSTESRLSKQRGDTLTFQKSDADADIANGKTIGMILSPNDKRAKDKKLIDEEMKIIDNRLSIDKKKENKTSFTSKEFKVASAFAKVSNILSVDGKIENKYAIEISNNYNMSIEDVFLLEKIAKNNTLLANKYKSKSACPCSKGKVKREDCYCNGKIGPGNPESDDGTLLKESEPGKKIINPNEKEEELSAEELAEVGKNVGL